jgi:general stress protein YciG
MPGTKAGAIKTAKTNKKRHGKDFYKKLGALGGAASKGTGFAMMDKERLREVSRKGGQNSHKATANKTKKSWRFWE